MIDGFIELGSGTSDSRNYMVCVLANKMDPNLVAEKTEDKSSPIKWIGKAIGYFNDLNDPAVRFETLKSPSIKDLVQAVEDQGLKAHITFAASKSCHLENTDIKKVIKHSYSKESALYGVVRISL